MAVSSWDFAQHVYSAAPAKQHPGPYISVHRVKTLRMGEHDHIITWLDQAEEGDLMLMPGGFEPMLVCGKDGILYRIEPYSIEYSEYRDVINAESVTHVLHLPRQYLQHHQSIADVLSPDIRNRRYVKFQAPQTPVNAMINLGLDEIPDDEIDADNALDPHIAGKHIIVPWFSDWSTYGPHSNCCYATVTNIMGHGTAITIGLATLPTEKLEVVELQSHRDRKAVHRPRIYINAEDRTHVSPIKIPNGLPKVGAVFAGLVRHATEWHEPASPKDMMSVTERVDICTDQGVFPVLMTYTPATVVSDASVPPGEHRLRVTYSI